MLQPYEGYYHPSLQTPVHMQKLFSNSEAANKQMPHLQML
jgi:hypothetical protein